MMVVDLCTPATLNKEAGGGEGSRHLAEVGTGAQEEATMVVDQNVEHAETADTGSVVAHADTGISVPLSGKRRRPTPVASDPIAGAAARKLLDDLVQGTDRWLLQPLEGLAARASRLVHRMRRESDRVAAISKMAEELKASLEL